MSDVPWEVDEKPAEAGPAEDESSESEDNYGKDLVGDEKDRQWLESLSALDRETVLAERFTKRKDREERRKAAARLRSKSKRKATSAAKSAAASKVDRLKNAKRTLEEKYEEDDEDYEDLSAKKSRGVGDVVGAPSSRRMSNTTGLEPGELEEVPDVVKLEDRATEEQAQSIRLQRSTLIKWQNEPFFTDTVVKCLVRVNLGQDSNQQATYRVAQIAEVKRKDKSYQVEAGKSSNVYLVLAIGENLKAFRLSAISNKPFTSTEYERFVKALSQSSKQPLSRQEVELKLKDITKARNFVYDEDEVNALVKERTQDLSALPINVLRHKKTELKARQRVAREQGDMESLEQIRAEIEAVEEEIEAKARVLERDDSRNAKVGLSYNERVREAMFKTDGDDYYEELEKEGDTGLANPFVRRKTVQHVMLVGEEADRIKAEEEEKRKKKEAEEKRREEEQRQREERIAQSTLLSDMHALKRKKTTDHDEESVVRGLLGVMSELEAAHDFELEGIDI